MHIGVDDNDDVKFRIDDLRAESNEEGKERVVTTVAVDLTVRRRTTDNRTTPR